ncbi:hypothetical protein HDZ31DRAFT_66103 [Schizophyllum fasciatum]
MAHNPWLPRIYALGGTSVAFAFGQFIAKTFSVQSEAADIIIPNCPESIFDLSYSFPVMHGLEEQIATRIADRDASQCALEDAPFPTYFQPVQCGLFPASVAAADIDDSGYPLSTATSSLILATCLIYLLAPLGSLVLRRIKHCFAPVVADLAFKFTLLALYDSDDQLLWRQAHTTMSDLIVVTFTSGPTNVDLSVFPQTTRLFKSCEDQNDVVLKNTCYSRLAVLAAAALDRRSSVALATYLSPSPSDSTVRFVDKVPNSPMARLLHTGDERAAVSIVTPLSAQRKRAGTMPTPESLADYDASDSFLSAVSDFDAACSAPDSVVTLAQLHDSDESSESRIVVIPPPLYTSIQPDLLKDDVDEVAHVPYRAMTFGRPIQLAQPVDCDGNETTSYLAYRTVTIGAPLLLPAEVIHDELCGIAGGEEEVDHVREDSSSLSSALSSGSSRRSSLHSVSFNEAVMYHDFSPAFSRKGRSPANQPFRRTIRRTTSWSSASAMRSFRVTARQEDKERDVGDLASHDSSSSSSPGDFTSPTGAESRLSSSRWFDTESSLTRFFSSSASSSSARRPLLLRTPNQDDPTSPSTPRPSLGKSARALSSGTPLSCNVNDSTLSTNPGVEAPMEPMNLNGEFNMAWWYKRKEEDPRPATPSLVSLAS